MLLISLISFYLSPARLINSNWIIIIIDGMELFGGRHWLCEFGSRHRLHVSDLLWQGTPKQPGPLRHNIPKNRLRGSTAKVISQSHSLLICHRCCYSRLRIDYLSHIFSILKLKLWNFHRLMFSLLQHQPQQATTCIDVLMIDSCDKGICFWCSSKRGM